MFQRLRIKLTIFNIWVIGGILIILASVIFWASPRNNPNNISQEMLETALNGVLTDSEPALLKHINRSKNDITYIRIDYTGNIAEKSLQKNISEENVKILIQRALSSNDYSGEIKLDENQSYLFLKIVLDKEKGTSIVFKKSVQKAEFYISFVSRTALFIIISLILVFFGSLSISGKALVPIKKAWQRQMDFTADASHELRTPITVIQTNLELVMGNPDETVKSQKKWLENILVENKRMSKLVDDLLTLSRADTNQQALDMNSFMIDKALEDAINPFVPIAANKEIELNACLEPQTEFFGDKNRLQQLMIILVDNALKYTNTSGQVDIMLKRIDKWVEISISDTGEGIEKEDLGKIFHRFYRVDKARTRDKGGSGLGLAIAKWIVEEHKGSINVESTPGKGTKFTIMLPMFFI